MQDIEDRILVKTMDLAGEFGHEAVMRVLLEKGLTPDAAAFGRVDILQYLLELGFGVDTNGSETTQKRFKDAETAVCYAATTGRGEAVRFLIEHGANLDHIRSQPMLPLHRAMRCEHIETPKLLLKHMDVTKLPKKSLMTKLC